MSGHPQSTTIPNPGLSAAECRKLDMQWAAFLLLHSTDIMSHGSFFERVLLYSPEDSSASPKSRRRRRRTRRAPLD